ncbi:GtrA family protein [Desulfonatronovibrio magnus]|uniref:GtrA family protein n=1 Tax=Desulfonatronovibrio magnus TaxID=698827 RepID=UPI0005EB7EDF
MFWSKFNKKNIIYQNFKKYIAVSLVGFTLSLGLTIFLHEICRLDPERAYAVALISVFIINFALMRYWVYSHTRTQSCALKQFTLMATSSALFRLIEYIVFIFLYGWLGIHYVLSILTIMSISAFSKFFFYNSFVFSKRVNRHPK